MSRGLRFNHVSLAIEAAIDGQGVVLTMHPLAASDIAAGKLTIPFGPHLLLDNAYYVVVADHACEQPAPVVFREWLLAEAQNDQELLQYSHSIVAASGF